MAKRLVKYDTNRKRKAPDPPEPTPSGVACTEKKCLGEMMWQEPQQQHPQLPELHRAACGECGWRGWC